MKTDTPLACNMNVFTPDQRDAHVMVSTRLFQQAQSLDEVENGYVFILPNHTDIITSLGEFIAGERRCCPFLKFNLSIDGDSEPVSLLITGPQGTQDFLRAEFSELIP